MEDIEHMKANYEALLLSIGIIERRLKNRLSQASSPEYQAKVKSFISVALNSGETNALNEAINLFSLIVPGELLKEARECAEAINKQSSEPLF